jgi:hypothetical protein
MPKFEIKINDVKTIIRGLTAWQVLHLRNRLRQAAPSETWVDDQIKTITDIDADGDQLTLTYFDSRVFPPGGRRETQMRWCRLCGRYTPRPAIHLIEHRKQRFGPVISATLQCDDCRISDDHDAHAELYQAGLHLQPAGSKSVVGLRALLSNRKSLA